MRLEERHECDEWFVAMTLDKIARFVFKEFCLRQLVGQFGRKFQAEILAVMIRSKALVLEKLCVIADLSDQPIIARTFENLLNRAPGLKTVLGQKLIPQVPLAKITC